MIFITYLGKMVLCSGILFGYYWLFLRNRRFHHYNRFYLLGTLVLSVLLPLVSLPVIFKPENKVNQVVYQVAETMSLPEPAAPEKMVAAIRSTPSIAQFFFTLENALWVLYLAGASYLLLLLGRSLYQVYRLRRQYPVRQLQRIRFYDTHDANAPFSFFRSIFWNSRIDITSTQGQQILRHELFHVQQRHSADILLAEVIIIFGWFNPFFRLLKKELKTIHEFLADRHAASGSDPMDYAMLLVQHSAQINSLSLSHNFSHKLIKRRITMITQFKQTEYGYWSRMMALPLLLILSSIVTLKAQRANPEPPSTALALHTSLPADNTIPTHSSPARSQEPRPAAKPAKQTAAVNNMPAGISPEKVRTLMQTVFTMTDAAQWLGTPVEKILRPNAGVWIYRMPGTELVVRFDLASDSIKNYNYTMSNDKVAAKIDYNAVRGIKEGITTADAISKQFGTPTRISIIPGQEAWEYKNDKTNFVIQFGAQKGTFGIVSTFDYFEKG